MTARNLGFTLLVLAACGDNDDHVIPPDAPAPGIDAAVGPGLDDFTPAEAALIATLGPLPAVPADPTNAYADNASAARLGQMLFFDRSYAGALVVGDDGTNGGLGQVGEAGRVSCQSCHNVFSPDLDDQRSLPGKVSVGTNLGTRNAHGLVNSSFYRWANWGGRFDSQWSLPLAVAENAAIMRSTRLQVAHLLFTKYRALYDATFPVPLDPALSPSAADAARFPAVGKPKAAADPDGPWELMAAADRDRVNVIFANFGKALAAYTRTLVSRNAPFDRYIAGDKHAIPDAAKRGIRTFLAECVSCHSGPNLSDNAFHVLGVPAGSAADLGRFQDVPALLASPFNSNGPFSDNTTTGLLTGLSQADTQRGQFRTKSLRGVAGSAPYMHTGGLATLADVVAFYDAGGGDVSVTGFVLDPKIHPLHLDAGARADLVELLRTFTGDAVPAARLVDTSY